MINYYSVGLVLYSLVLFQYFYAHLLIIPLNYQDDEGDNAFHIAADAAKMIRENLEWLILMLKYPDADVDVRNHR